MNNSHQNNTALPQIPSDVREFLEELLVESDMGTLEKSMYEDLMKQLYEQLDRFITAKIVEAMPEKHLDEFIKMNEEQRPRQEIEQFLSEKLPNTKDVFTQAFIQFREFYLREKQSTLTKGS